MTNDKEFFIGLDVGTNSCGIAATDGDYNLLRFRGNDMWAVELFDEAKSAKQRRDFRCMRRRLWRRQQRIDLLQDLFAEEISKVDPTFFLRLNNSALWADDKDERLSDNFLLFSENGYTDREYHKKYPTIFHLRRDVIAGKETEIRHIYLAVHHIIKYRGNFLSGSGGMEEVDNVSSCLKALNDYISENLEECDIIFDEDKFAAFSEATKSGKNLTDLKSAANEIFGTKTKQGKEISAALCGGGFSWSNVFGDEKYKESEGNKISFKNADAVDKIEAFVKDYPETSEFVLNLKALFDKVLLEKILGGQKSVSVAMVKIYEKHREDLKMLKSVIKKYLPKEYNAVFRLYAIKQKSEKKGKSEKSKKLNNYCAYVGLAKTNGEKHYVERCNKAEFYDFLKKTLAKAAEIANGDKDYETIIKELESGDFLPRISDADGGVFPQQINALELKSIVAQLKKFYPSFDKAEDGMTKAEKIEKIFSFKIPYYVGPLTAPKDENQKSNSWIVKKEGKVLPWNFEKIVDEEKTAERFIRRMTNKCTYVKGADVLPKQSILYQKFKVLNCINKMTINAVPISVETKHKIFEGFYLTTKKPTKKKLVKWLQNNGIVSKTEETVIGGVTDELTDDMSSYVTFVNIFGADTEKYIDVMEDIILCYSLFTEKDFVEKRIMRKYGDIPAVAENIKRIRKLSFKDFGRLSRELLTELRAYGAEETDEGEIPVTIMDLLWVTNMNFMEILHDKRYGFSKALEVRNGDKGGFDGNFDDYYLSPGAERGVRRALAMVEEYVKAVKRAPDKIFVEVTRGPDEKKERKSSRYKELVDFYKANKKFIEDYDRLIGELSQYKDSSKLRSERLYLYFRQFGRCAYSGEKIDLGELSGEGYDVDHIIPRSLIKDESVHNNKVLVLRRCNRDKSDYYPLSEIPDGNPQKSEKVVNFWKFLLKAEAINETKFARLMRTEPLQEDELQDFVNRQLTFTGQTVIALASILKEKYPESRVVYSKAGNVSDFRDRFKLYKNREVNDLHHAHDAYLNIVVGNVFDKRFSGNPREYLYEREDGKTRVFNVLNIYNRNIKGAWKKGETIATVKEVYGKNSMRVIRVPSLPSGEFYKQTILPKGEGTVPIKQKGALSSIEKYGGYTQAYTAYFVAVDSVDKKGNTMRTIEAIPTYYDRMAKMGVITLETYLEKFVGLKNAEIVLPHISVKSLLRYEGTLLYIAGTSENRWSAHNANQWFISKENSDYLRLVYKALERRAELKEEENAEELLVATSRDGKRKDYVTKMLNAEIYELIENQLRKPIYGGVSTFSNVLKCMENGRQKFDGLTILEQCEVLKQLVGFMQCKGLSADLEKIGGSKNSGKIQINKVITDKNVSIVNYSPAGLYRNTIIVNRVDKD